MGTLAKMPVQVHTMSKAKDQVFGIATVQWVQQAKPAMHLR